MLQGVGQELKAVLARIPGGDALTGARLSPESCAPATMSSASGEPGNGDAAERSLLGLDTVIQVSGVAAFQHPPKSRLQRHFKREGTL